MNSISLTQDIDNDKGYIDQVISEIKACVQGEPLTMEITCEGGDVYQGARLHRAILEHDGETTAVVIGLAASMAGVLLSAFDKVEIDHEADIMLHKGHVVNKDNQPVSETQNDIINKFNKRAYARMLQSGVDEEFLNDVFLNPEVKDVWLTAKEAEQKGIGKVIKIERRDGSPFKIAAKLKDNFKQNNNKNMGLFGKTAVTRQHVLPDGRTVIYNSASDSIQKGDKLTLIGSNEVLKGNIRLSNKFVAQISDGVVNEVVEEDMPKAVVSDDQFAELAQMVTDMQAAIAGILEKIGANEEKETEQVAAIANTADELKASNKVAAELLASALEVAATFKTAFKLDKIEVKNELDQDLYRNMTAKEKHAAKLEAAIRTNLDAK